MVHQLMDQSCVRRKQKPGASRAEEDHEMNHPPSLIKTKEIIFAGKINYNVLVKRLQTESLLQNKYAKFLPTLNWNQRKPQIELDSFIYSAND